MPIAAALSEHSGWPSVFYVFGACAVLVLGPWLYFAHDKPEDSAKISQLELSYIKAFSSISEEKLSSAARRVPWSAILTSSKVWAISITKFCNNWGMLFLRSKLPAYLKSVLQMPITYVSAIFWFRYYRWFRSFILNGLNDASITINSFYRTAT